jgi:hypothetical protein
METGMTPHTPQWFSEQTIEVAMNPTEENKLTTEQSKWLHVYHGLMAPLGKALQHPAVDMLLDFALQGCPMDMGK